MDDKSLPTAREAAQRRAEELLRRLPSSSELGTGGADGVRSTAAESGKPWTAPPTSSILLPWLLFSLPFSSNFALMCNCAIVLPLVAWKFLIMPVTVPLGLLARVSLLFRFFLAVVLVGPSYVIHFVLARTLMATSWLWCHVFIFRPVPELILGVVLAIVGMPVAILDGAIVIFVQQALGESDPVTLTPRRTVAVLWPDSWFFSFFCVMRLLSAYGGAFPPRGTPDEIFLASMAKQPGSAFGKYPASIRLASWRPRG